MPNARKGLNGRRSWEAGKNVSQGREGKLFCSNRKEEKEPGGIQNVGQKVE